MEDKVGSGRWGDSTTPNLPVFRTFFYVIVTFALSFTNLEITSNSKYE